MSEMGLLILIGLTAGIASAGAVLALTKAPAIWNALCATPGRKLWAHLTRQT